MPRISFKTFLAHFTASLIVGTLLFFAFTSHAQASVTYDRTPSDFTNEGTPDSVSFDFHIVADDPADLGFSDPEIYRWGVQVVAIDETTYYNSSCGFIDGSMDQTFTLELPIAEYGFVGLVGYPAGECGNQSLIQYGNDLDYDDNNPLFEVIEGEEPEPEPNPNWEYERFPTGLGPHEAVTYEVTPLNDIATNCSNISLEPGTFDKWTVFLGTSGGYFITTTDTHEIDDSAPTTFTFVAPDETETEILYARMMLVGDGTYDNPQSNGGDYAGGEYVTCGGDFDIIEIDVSDPFSDPIFSLQIGGDEPVDDNDLGQMIENANVQFSSTTGFDIPVVVQWAGDNLIGMLVGSVLGVILGLRYWIVAFVIIGSILYFSYRAFRFFKH